MLDLEGSNTGEIMFLDKNELKERMKKKKKGEELKIS